MAEENSQPLESRPPTKKDFLALCRSLNENQVDYVVVGGMAVIQHGYLRATEDIDLLVSSNRQNERRLYDALLILPDQAVRELEIGDLDRYVVIRIADEIVVDLMKSACGVDYSDAEDQIETVLIDGVSIPFASLELLKRMKQTMREKDKLDLLFIEERLRNR